MAKPVKAAIPAPKATKLAVVADVHLGNHAGYAGETRDGLNDRGRLCVETFRRSLVKAREEGCTAYLIAGDVFHSSKPTPPLVAAVQEALKDRGDMEVIAAVGNHDMIDASPLSRSTSMEALVPHGLVVNRGPTWYDLGFVDLLVISFTAEEDMATHIVKTLELERREGSKTRLLMAHVGVYDDSTAPWLKSKKDAIPDHDLLEALEANGFAGAFVGNYHNGKLWKSEKAFIHQIGTLAPATHSDDSVYPEVGGMAVWAEGSSIGNTVQIYGPRFITLDPGVTLRGTNPENSYFIRARVGADGVKPSGLAIAAGISYVDQVPELVETPAAAVTGVEEAITEFGRSKGYSEDIIGQALRYYAKSSL